MTKDLISAVTFAALATGVVAATAMPSAQEIRVVVANPATIASQKMPKGTGQIAGQVVDEATRRPLSGAIVSLTLIGRSPVRAMSDADGRFAFDELPPGRFDVGATLSGHAAGAHGRLRPSGGAVPIDLDDGQRLANIRIGVWPLGAVAGTVIDDLGEPVVGAAVQAYRRAIAGGRWQFSPAASDTTDDRGDFRIGSLEPGSYVVAVAITPFSWPASLENHMLLGAEWPDELGALPEATRDLVGTGLQIGPKSLVVVQATNRIAPSSIAADGRIAIYATQYFSGADAIAVAAPIAIAAGEVRSGVDFALRLVPTVIVSGTVSGPAGGIGDLVVRLVPAGVLDLSTPVDAALSVTDGLGRFTFVGVVPGQYTVRVLNMPRGEARMAYAAVGGRMVPASGLPQAALPKDPVLWGEQAVAVGTTNLTGIAVPLHVGVRVRGRVEFAGTRSQPAADAISRIALSLTRVDDRPPAAARGRVDPDLQFSTLGVAAGRYVLRVVNVPEGWFLQSAVVAGRDITVDPIDLEADLAGVRLILAERPTGVGGTVTSAAGTADAAATVVIFAADPSAWVGRGASPRQLRSARTTATGAYSVRDLPAGEYFVAAIAEAVAGDWQEPAFLTTLSRSAARVEVVAGEIRTVTLRTLAIDRR